MTLPRLTLALIVAVLLYVTWLNLPVSINRYQDIRFAEGIIERIDEYQKKYGVPRTGDWDTLRKFGFKEGPVGFDPTYERIDTTTYKLIFLRGFDGPYLQWNSKERKWKED